MTLDLRSDKVEGGVRIVETTPAVSRERLFAHRRCYMGISLDNPVFTGATLKTLLRWATGHFDKCLIVVGDYLRRYNEQIFSALTGPAAAEAALGSGQEFLDRNRDLLASFDSEKLVVTRWQPCLTGREYLDARQTLADLYGADDKFRAAVQRDGAAFLRRQQRHGRKLAVEEERAIELSCEYLLEEIAVFSSLAQQGWKVELYPGPELDVLVEAARGDYTGIPAGLKDRVNVELRLHKGRS